jgi:hypothetical protein
MKKRVEGHWLYGPGTHVLSWPPAMPGWPVSIELPVWRGAKGFLIQGFKGLAKAAWLDLSSGNFGWSGRWELLRINLGDEGDFGPISEIENVQPAKTPVTLQALGLCTVMVILKENEITLTMSRAGNLWWPRNMGRPSGQKVKGVIAILQSLLSYRGLTQKDGRNWIGLCGLEEFYREAEEIILTGADPDRLKKLREEWRGKGI